ncbi:Lrp/AsnC family transcriptional regulator [Candidatus Pseudothioglobus singularis]|jgi:DNA-binding Lrp family transcriptional regulator|nr:Lrp/AsnC family transcriptional regulator [Candidatus Pseudothioglobus singularis]MDA7438568.1 Lrp/AsnC family transcriptional regulator [Candidatus Pseudothioglobus singularis]MDA9029116.1 Lrp/AsnC family transcriptional regulator [Candidatus Pseudothioglobus singularis]MDB4597591.1 Lrp/AsnC family transcriptional regulator [Candidatus Pseudothioglobus singularis]MDB4822324.1 Lrp/AsnC family transcriptional regulator [Candidatus Pseudothioglobus singularis]MDC0964528.1 Lrp/AsnC family tran|tara:strand:- start:11 stop:493 length:483 start_codon:yes stop_codon:yes gene_type:complete
MDSKDLRILSILQKNGRIPISELAIKLNMSDTPCLRRVKKLENAGVISGYTANIRADSLGFNAIVYVFVRLTENSNSNADLFEDSVKDLPEVLECSVISGSHDYLLKIISHDLLSYESFIKQSIGNLRCVSSIESTVVLKQTFSRQELPIIKTEKKMSFF